MTDSSLHTGGVTGSIPVAPTNYSKENSYIDCESAPAVRRDTQNDAGTSGAIAGEIRGRRRWPRREIDRPPSRVRPVPEIGANAAARFWKKVEGRGADDCWPWTAAAQKDGYGRVKIKGHLYGAHRVAYTLAKGIIPALAEYHGAEVMHSCDNPPCCNPKHLGIGDQAKNVADMHSKGRAKRAPQ